MPFTIPDEVGDLYDLGLEVRDVTQPLTVKNRRGDNIQLTRVAYVCTPSEKQEEATELQRKQQLVQLGPTLMDREWDAWPGQTQGDWSSGLGQRIQFGGHADPAAYWDGLGIIWPITDYLPQQPFQPPAYTDANQPSPGVPDYMGTVDGFLPGPGEGYAQVFKNGATVHVVFLNAAGKAFDVSNPITGAGSVQGMEIAHGYIWLVGSDAANKLSLFTVDGTGTAAKFATVSTATAVAAPGAICSGRVTNRQYVCTVARITVAGNYTHDEITVWDVTGVAATPNASAFTLLEAPTGWTVEDAEFLSDDLIVSMSDGQNSIIAAWNIASQSWRTLAQVPGAQSCGITPLAGGLFVVAQNKANATSQALELYLLQGSSLQEYGPLIPQIGSTPFPYVTAHSHPTAFGPYAIFAVECQSAPGSNVTVLIYAYDVLRGRVFKVASVAGLPSSYAGALDRVPIAVFSSLARTSPVAFNCQWGLALNVNNTQVGAANIQEFDVGIQTSPGNSGPLLQLPFDGISGTVDYTSAVPKLFRQVQARFPALPASALSSVTLKVWLDQDPGQLAAAPDFTATINGGANPGATSLSLFVNKMAVKLVYEIITTGGVYSGGIWVNAPKIISVSTQAATGWVWHMFLGLSRNTTTNDRSPDSYVWDRQQAAGLDETAAANFIRLLWRQRGGQCVAYLPNGDTYNALIQQYRRTSPKPWASSFRSDIPDDRFEAVAEIVFREDV